MNYDFLDGINPVMPPTNSTPTLRRIGMIAVALAWLIAWPVYDFHSAQVDQTQLTEYTHSPACGGQSVDPSLPACTDAVATVTALYGATKGRDAVVALKVGDANERSVEIPDQTFQALHVDDAVSIRIWQTQTREISRDGIKYLTTSHPETQLALDRRSGILWGVSVIVAIVALSISIWKYRQGDYETWVPSWW